MTLANDIFYEHYMILFDSESDKGEECLITLLAKKSALATIKYLKKQQFSSKLINFDEVEKEINSI